MRGRCYADRFVYGDVERISPEAPIPVFRIISRKCHAGWRWQCRTQYRWTGWTDTVRIYRQEMTGGPGRDRSGRRNWRPRRQAHNRHIT